MKQTGKHSYTIIKQHGINPPCIYHQREWTRIEMLLYGGTAWFNLVLSVFMFENAYVILREDNVYNIPMWIMYLQLLAGVLIITSLFVRPAWRGIKGILLWGLATATEVAYLYALIRASNVLNLTVLDEVIFCFFICVAFFRAVFDSLLRRELSRCPNRSEHQVTTHLKVNKNDVR